MTPEDDLSRRLQNWIHGTIGFCLFLAGVLARIASIVISNANGLPAKDFLSPLLDDLGAVLIAAIAIPFFYERLLRKEETRIIQHEIMRALDIKLAGLGLERTRPQLHEEGRLPIEEKRALIQNAQVTVIQIGISARTFVSYFEQRPVHDFKQPVIAGLQRGVCFTVLLLDPDSDVATTYAQLHQDPGAVERIRQSIAVLHDLQKEFASLQTPGKFQVRLYRNFPIFDMLVIDPEDENGRAVITPYLPGSKRADNPGLEIYRRSNPMFFDKYYKSVQHLLAVSWQLET